MTPEIFSLLKELPALAMLGYVTITLLKQRAEMKHQNVDPPKIANGSKMISELECLKSQQDIKDTVSKQLDKYYDRTDERLEKLENRVLANVLEVKSSIRTHEGMFHKPTSKSD